MLYRERNAYEKYIKRLLDIICSLLALIVFGWVYLLIGIMVYIKLGRPILFKQPRPGLIDPKTNEERIFEMYKFRTMTDERDEHGKLLPDEQRLTEFGRKLHASSLDELPEVLNILKGDMSVIGPRPQLVRDLVFMSAEQRMRHTARPGLSGLAQIKGRNALVWEKKFSWDLEYIKRVSFLTDAKIVWLTFRKVFLRSDMPESNEEIDLTSDYGDYLLKNHRISQDRYEALQSHADRLLEDYYTSKRRYE